MTKPPKTGGFLLHMNIERAIPIREIEKEAQPRLTDFAEIRNPLGHTPKLPELMKSKGTVSEEQLMGELSALWHIDRDHIVLSLGSTGLIDQIPSLLMSRQGRAVLPVPTYFGLLDTFPKDHIAQVALSPHDKFAATAAFEHRLLWTISLVQPELVWLCSPNNPTGVTMPLHSIARIAQATPGLVVVDEAYQEIVDPRGEQSAIRLISTFPNILVTRTFSKAYGLPDIRVGVGIAHPRVAGILRAARAHPMVPSALTAASAALLDQEHIERSHELIVRESAWFFEQTMHLKHIEMGAKTESGVCILRRTDGGNLFRQLQAEGIKTMDFNHHRGLEGMGFVRLGLLDRARNELLVQALKQSDQKGFL